MNSFSDLTQPQHDRFAFEKLRVRFIGEIRGQDLDFPVWLKDYLAMNGGKHAVLASGYRFSTTANA